MEQLSVKNKAKLNAIYAEWIHYDIKINESNREQERIIKEQYNSETKIKRIPNK